MNRIYKYSLETTDKQFIDLPRGAKILSVIEQFDNIVMYALIDDENVEHNDVEEVEIRIVGTGHAFIDSDNFVLIGTVVQHIGNFVWHVFRRNTKGAQIDVGDTVHMRTTTGYKAHTVTQFISSNGLDTPDTLILDSGRFVKSVLVSAFEWHNGWFER